MAQDFRELKVWQKAIDLTTCVYELTSSFPREEIYGLVSQTRRSSVSVASNIAEGRGRLNRAEFRQFLGFSQGSLFELKTQLHWFEISEWQTKTSLHTLNTSATKFRRCSELYSNTKRKANS